MTNMISHLSTYFNFNKAHLRINMKLIRRCEFAELLLQTSLIHLYTGKKKNRHK